MRQLDVLWHDGHTLGVDGAQIGVLEQTDQVGLTGLLQSPNGGTLEPEICLEILGNLPHQPLEGQLPDEKLGGLLVTPDLPESDCAGPVSVGLLEWLVNSKSGDNVELVTEEILEDMVDKFEYVVAYFQAYCREGDEACQTTREDILVGLEDIDDNVDEIGISMVTTKDVKYARKLGIQKLPCVGLFRNGDFQAFTGDLKNEINVLNWLSDIETLEIPGVIG